jgi:small subunit ribosomal protein S4
MHGKDAKPKKMLGYGLQLREKQKARRYYRLLEVQFRNLFEKAARMKGVTGENMLALLERRLDNVIYRMGFGTSRAQARQIVRPGDTVEVREGSRKNGAINHAIQATAHAPAPNWLDIDRNAFRARILHSPKREELVQIQLNEQLIVELYSK